MGGPLLAVEHTDALPWLIAAAIVLGAWAVLFAIVATVTMPRLPDAGPETMELGPEPPAIANLLVNRCELTTSAIAATLVDLAARHHVALDHIGGGENLVRLRTHGDGTPNAYETQVLALVRDRAKNDTVPAAELSLGYGKNADEWWKKFQRSVTDDARARGLVRRRFSTAQSVLLAATLAVPFAIAAIGLEYYGAAERAAGKKMDVGSGFWIAGAVWLVLLLIAGSILRGWRETGAGATATAHWLGVENFLAHDESFRETPPAGVAIWDRLLAYGVAVGAAHGTDAALPIGPTCDDEGWSPYRGLWRQVRITYPRRFGYGDSPRRAAAMSILVLAGTAVIGIVVARTLVPALVDLPGEVANDDNGAARWFVVPVAAVLLVPVIFVTVHVVRGIVMLRRAVADFGKTVTFEGYVVRVPWHYEKSGDDRVWAPSGYTAVDDGTSDEVHALRCYTPDIREGQVVRVTVTPRMRHVVHIEPVA